MFLGISWLFWKSTSILFYLFIITFSLSNQFLEKTKHHVSVRRHCSIFPAFVCVRKSLLPNSPHSHFLRFPSSAQTRFFLFPSLSVPCSSPWDTLTQTSKVSEFDTGGFTSGCAFCSFHLLLSFLFLNCVATN